MREGYFCHLRRSQIENSFLILSLHPLMIH